MSGSIDLVVAVLGAIIIGVGGYFIRGSIEKKKEAKRLHQEATQKKEESKKIFTEHIDILSAKTFSIGRDIIFYTHSYDFDKEYQEYTDFDGTSIRKQNLEMKELAKQRALENLEIINQIDTSNYDDSHKEIKIIIDEYKNASANLRRIMTLKSDDDQKMNLLKNGDQSLQECYAKLMKAYDKFL
jgi:hypothetical protein